MSGLQLSTTCNMLFDFDFTNRNEAKSTDTNADPTKQYSVFSHQDTSKIGEILIRSEVIKEGSTYKPYQQTEYPRVVGLETLADGSKKILIHNSNSNPGGNAIHLDNTYFYFINKFDIVSGYLDVSLGFYLDMEVNLLTPTTQLISPFTLPLIMFRSGGGDLKQPDREAHDGLLVKIVFDDVNIESPAVGKLYLHDKQPFDFKSTIWKKYINKITVLVTKKEDTPQPKYQLIFKLNNTAVDLLINEFSGVNKDHMYPINPFNFSNRYVGTISGGAPWKIRSLFPGTINKFKFTPFATCQITDFSFSEAVAAAVSSVSPEEVAEEVAAASSSATVFPSQQQIEKLYQYNELDTEYDKLMSQKDKILEQDKKHELIIRSSQNIQKKIVFYNQQIKRLKIVTLVVHIILAVIIIIALVYQEIARRS